MRHGIGGVLTSSFIVSLLVAAAAGVSTGRGAGMTQIDSQRGVTVKATYLTPAYLKAAPSDPLAGKVDLLRTVAFAIDLDTHNGDLSKYDLVKNVVLRIDGGQHVQPLQWVATADGAHHRAGGLMFRADDASGRPIGGQVKTLELIVRNLGDVPERRLLWTMPLE